MTSTWARETLARAAPILLFLLTITVVAELADASGGLPVGGRPGSSRGPRISSLAVAAGRAAGLGHHRAALAGHHSGPADPGGPGPGRAAGGRTVAVRAG